MKIGICDTSIQNAQTTKSIIEGDFLAEDWFQMETYLPNEVIFDIEEHTFDCDIIILNTFFPEQNIDGIWMGQQINNNQPSCQIIYITDEAEMYSEIYEVQHCYLILRSSLKSFLKKAILKGWRLNQELMKQDVLEVVSDGHKVHIRQKDILYIERKKRMVYVVTSVRAYPSYESLKSMEQRLKFPLLRCHTGYIVNLATVANIGQNYVEGFTKYKIPLGRTFALETRRKYLQYWSGIDANGER